jgi:hypothetical protein
MFERETSELKKGKVMWLRGVSRLQTQAQVVRAFQSNLERSKGVNW